MSDALPRDEDAEADLLCGILVTSGRALDDIDITAAEMFRPVHETIYAACLALHSEGRPAEVRTVIDRLRRDGDLARIGGPIEVAQLSTRMASPASVTYYARIIREGATRRSIIAAGTRLQHLAAEPTEDPGATVEQARTEIDGLADRLGGAAERDLQDDLDAVIDEMERGVSTMATPWQELDDLIGGWRKGAIYVVAARPGGGKSIFGVQAAIDAMLTHKVPAAMQSMEMTRSEVLQRGVSMLGKVNLSHIVKGGPWLGADEWTSIAEAGGRLAETRFAIDDRSSLTVADIRGAVARCKRRHGSCGLVVVDYLQLLASTRRAENRQVEVASFSRDLKIAAKQLEVPIVVLAQLNRGPESEKRPPRMSDLRESGAVEQDADVIILLHRDEEAAPDVLHVGVAKNRHGPKGSFKLAWEGQFSRLGKYQWRPSDVLAGREPERAA